MLCSLSKSKHHTSKVSDLSALRISRLLRTAFQHILQHRSLD
jgi:hypothetical protein